MSIAERLERPSLGRPQRTAELFRAVNNRIRELAADWPDDYEFMCECNDETCTRVLRMTVEEYEELRADPALFVVLPGHEQPDDDEIERSKEIVIVRTRGG
jgi:hypothetical protein